MDILTKVKALNVSPTIALNCNVSNLGLTEASYLFLSRILGEIFPHKPAKLISEFLKINGCSLRGEKRGITLNLEAILSLTMNSRVILFCLKSFYSNQHTVRDFSWTAIYHWRQLTQIVMTSFHPGKIDILKHEFILLRYIKQTSSPANGKNDFHPFCGCSCP